MYKLSINNFVLQGAIYNMLIGQHLWCITMLETQRMNWWIPSKHLYWVYHYQLHIDGFEIHQLTFNDNEFMDMLTNDPRPWHVIWWHHKKCCFVFNDMVDKSNYDDFQIKKILAIFHRCHHWTSNI
jgi:hypothetical protein